MASLQQKHNNPLNTSTSKQQYSFSKTTRFKNQIQTEGSDSFYQMPNIKQNIAYSFGHSTRNQLGKSVKNIKYPSPTSYDIHGDIQNLLKKKDGIKFNYGRQQCKSGNIFKTSDIPGPGQYNPNPQIIEKKIGKDYSMGKIPTSKRLLEGAILPGPGAYSINSLILNENKVLSKETKKSYGKIIFPKIHTDRMKTEPNPSLRLPQVTYRGQKLIQNQKGFSLSKSPRFKLKYIADQPGPGAYQKFSEFIENSKK